MKRDLNTQNSRIDYRVLNGLKLIGVIATLIMGLALGIRLAIWMLPFTLALIMGQMLEPPIRFLQKHTPLKRPIWAVAIGLLFFALIGFVIYLLVAHAVDEIRLLSLDWGNIANSISRSLESLLHTVESKLEIFGSGPSLDMDGIFDTLNSAVYSLIRQLLTAMASFATSLPQVLMGVLVTIVATILLMSSRDRILQFAQRQFPDIWVAGALNIRNDLLGALGGYFKAQAKIMTIVFIELLIGFSIIGSQYAVLIALSTALLDALPVFGAGAVLIPSALWGLIFGDYRMGIGCAIMYGCTLVLRQMLEPKMLGQEIGLHPLLTLASMYGGLSIAGVIGLIGGPIFVLVFKNLFVAYMDGRTVGEVINETPEEKTKKKADAEKQKAKKGSNDRMNDENSNEKA